MATTKDYGLCFDTQQYLRRFNNPRPTPYYLLLTYFHRFWQGISDTKLKLLEFGGGPSIYPLISACSHVQDIVFSEYNTENRRAVELWCRKEEGAFDWTRSIELVARELEGKDQNEVIIRENELRRKLQAIVHCDINNQAILDTESLPEALGPPFDVVSTTLCLESVIESNDDYKQAVVKLAKLLKPGGYLVMSGALGGTFYMIGGKRYYDFPLTRELVLEAMQMAKLQSTHIMTDPVSPEPGLTDANHVFFATGRAPGNGTDT